MRSLFPQQPEHVGVSELQPNFPLPPGLDGGPFSPPPKHVVQRSGPPSHLPPDSLPASPRSLTVGLAPPYSRIVYIQGIIDRLVKDFGLILKKGCGVSAGGVRDHGLFCGNPQDWSRGRHLTLLEASWGSVASKRARNCLSCSAGWRPTRCLRRGSVSLATLSSSSDRFRASARTSSFNPRRRR